MDQMSQMTVTFRCPPELEPLLPQPIPAVQGMPDWFKAMPQKGYSEINQKDLLTMKKCPPVIDAMAYGFLLPLVSDLRVENGEFFWDRDVPSGGITSLTALADRLSRQRAGRRHAVLRRRPLHHQVQQFLDHRNAARLFAAVHASAQPHRSAVHHHRRAGRYRQLHRQSGQHSRHAGTTPRSMACCRRARRSRNAFRSSARNGRRVSMCCRTKRPRGSTKRR